MKLAEALREVSAETVTTNGARAIDTTGSRLLDFYAMAGAMREANRDTKVGKFGAAWEEDNLLAMKLLFYTRDIRGGLGERDTFRELLKHAGDNCTKAVVANMDLIGGVYGRFDDLYALIGTRAEKDMWKYMRTVYDADMENMAKGESVSLWAKWVASPNSKSSNTKKLGDTTAKGMGFGKRGYVEYCKNISKLRAYIDIPEIKIAAKDYASIDYGKLASKCLMKYRGAFRRYDGERYASFFERVETGEEEINASTLVPYDIMSKVMNCYSEQMYSSRLRMELEEMWKALPDYLNGEKSNILVMCDTSGSMEGKPLSVAVSLSIYFAERNFGEFHNQFMSFSREPSLVSIVGDNLYTKYDNISKTHWDMSTNIQGAFELLLETAKKLELKKDEIPKAILIISDMQFNPSWCNQDKTLYEALKRKFADAGYCVPNIVFWNVNGTKAVFHANKDQYGVQLVSGENPSVFKQIMSCLSLNAYEAMMKVLNSERYSMVTLE